MIQESNNIENKKVKWKEMSQVKTSYNKNYSSQAFFYGKQKVLTSLLRTDSCLCLIFKKVTYYFILP